MGSESLAKTVLEFVMDVEVPLERSYFTMVPSFIEAYNISEATVKAVP